MDFLRNTPCYPHYTIELWKKANEQKSKVRELFFLRGRMGAIGSFSAVSRKVHSRFTTRKRDLC